eukprot:CAMPEP_0180395476 /NCGR_PEP_ID=MMETSP0989-20121125/34912_1 /TAXON_ID=697907 /ORGANISM="non described non described, Strain CCMP2293" /LENGTH=181 /DNA_ID=CAMNT_0022397647 /DNA_START=75 /DNA_END=620 /DNA_ORIENTATION=-
MTHLLPVLARFGVNLSTKHADLLYIQLGAGSTGNINYPDFLKTYTQPLYRPGAVSAPPRTSLPGINGGAATRDPAALRKAKLLRAASSKWRALRQACSLLDQARTKALPRATFKAVLLRLGIVTSDSSFEDLMDDYRSPFAQDSILTLDHNGASASEVHRGGHVDYILFIEDAVRRFPPQG